MEEKESFENTAAQTVLPEPEPSAAEQPDTPEVDETPDEPEDSTPEEEPEVDETPDEPEDGIPETETEETDTEETETADAEEQTPETQEEDETDEQTDTVSAEPDRTCADAEGPAAPEPPSEAVLEEFLEKIRSEVGSAIITSMKDVTAHNEEFFRRQQAESERNVFETERGMIKEMASLYEKYIRTMEYCEEQTDAEAVKDVFRKLDRDFERMFKKCKVTVSSVELGDDATEESVENVIRIAYTKKESEEKWNTIAKLLNAHYYTYKDVVVVPQDVAIFKEEDRT